MSYFQVGDILKATTNFEQQARPVVAGTCYQVKDVEKTTYPFGDFVTYWIEGPDGKQFAVANVHLLFSAVRFVVTCAGCGADASGLHEIPGEKCCDMTPDADEFAPCLLCGDPKPDSEPCGCWDESEAPR